MRLMVFFGGPEAMAVENYDQTPLLLIGVCELGAAAKTWDTVGNKAVEVKMNWAATRQRYTLMVGVSSMLQAAPPSLPEMVFKGKGKVKYTRCRSISTSSQVWIPCRCYNRMDRCSVSFSSMANSTSCIH